MKMVFFCLFAMSFGYMHSQHITYNDLNDVRVDSLMERVVQINTSKKGVKGYRVQIHHDQSQSREDSQNFRAKFSKDFPNLKTYLEYKSPYYKIQIGNFITKLEAYKVQKEISKKYRGSYIVPAYVQYEHPEDLSK